jgi:hypothetical protein
MARFGSVNHILAQLGLDPAAPRDEAPAVGDKAQDATSAKPLLHPGRDAASERESQRLLTLPVGRRGLALSRDECRLLAATISHVRRFANGRTDISVAVEVGALSVREVNGVVVLECRCHGVDRPLRMTAEKVKRMLEHEGQIKSFATRR